MIVTSQRGHLVMSLVDVEEEGNIAFQLSAAPHAIVGLELFWSSANQTACKLEIMRICYFPEDKPPFWLFNLPQPSSRRRSVSP